MQEVAADLVAHVWYAVDDVGRVHQEEVAAAPLAPEAVGGTSNADGVGLMGQLRIETTPSPSPLSLKVRIEADCLGPYKSHSGTQWHGPSATARSPCPSRSPRARQLSYA